MRLRLSLLGSLIFVSLAACGGRVSFGPDPEPGNDGGGGGYDAGYFSDGGIAHDSGRTDPFDASTVHPPRCAATCSDPAGPTTTYGSIADVQAALLGIWTLCSGHMVGPADAIGLELDTAGGKAYYLVAGAGGKPVRGQGFDYQLNLKIIDTTMMNGPGVYQIDLEGGSFGWDFFSTYSECPRKLQIRNGSTGELAEFAADDSLQSQACSLVGTWDLTQSDNGSEGAFQFASDGTFIGGAAGASLPQAKTFGGQYEMSTNNVMTIDSSYGMGCGYSATYQATFGGSCSTVALHELTDGCTGAREYLHIDQTLTRR